jgi:polyisoprenoid-binding protein YceI
MRTSFIIIVFSVIWGQNIWSQKYFTKTGQVSFFSDASLEKIEATNKSATCVFDPASNKIEWGVLIKGFQFEKALMQEHFNENYMESTKFPKATFKGVVSGFNASHQGSQKVKVSGELTMHGVTKPINIDAVMHVKGTNIEASSTFNVALADYKISIPAVVKDQIAKVVKINISGVLVPLK